MKTFKVTSCLLLLVSIFQTSLAVVPETFQPVNSRTAGNNTLVKATRLNGVWIPVVDLPMIEIIALKSNSVVLGVIRSNNRNVLLANLPVIEVTALKITPGKIRTGYRNGAIVIMADLPVIEVVSDFPESKLISTSATGNLPFVTLPEVIVSDTPKGLLAEAVETSGGSVNPIVNLPEITVTQDGPTSGGFPQYHTGSNRWTYFIAERGRWLIESIIRSFIF